MILYGTNLALFGLICFILGILPPLAYHMKAQPKRDKRGRFKAKKLPTTPDENIFRPTT